MAEQFLDGDLVMSGFSGLHLSVATEVFFTELIAFFMVISFVTMAWVLTPIHAIGDAGFAGLEKERRVFFICAHFSYHPFILFSRALGVFGMFFGHVLRVDNL